MDQNKTVLVADNKGYEYQGKISSNLGEFIGEKNYFADLSRIFRVTQKAT